MQLLKKLTSILNVSQELETQLRKIAFPYTLKKGETILNINERSNHLYFVDKGLLRGYYFSDEKEITNWFANENDFATCFYSFITKELSFETIEALEDTQLTGILHADLEELYKNFPETERLGRIITQTYYIQLEERLLNLQFKTAKERYQKFSETHAELLQRVTLGQVASYLGITPETLSRIRSEK